MDKWQPAQLGVFRAGPIFLISFFDYIASQIVLSFQQQKFLKSPFTFFVLFFL